MKLGFGFPIRLTLFLWSTSRTVMTLLAAVNIAYEKAERRRLIAVSLIASAFTLAAVVVIIAGIARLGRPLAAVDKMKPPPGLTGLSFSSARCGCFGRSGFSIPLFAANRRRPDSVADPRHRAGHAVPGGPSVGFSAYVLNFGKYNETFRAFAAEVLLLCF